MNHAMKRRLYAVLGMVVAIASAAAQSPKTLDIYTIDVEGGKSVLMVSPSGESMLIDVGWPKSATRDASTDAIFDAVKKAGVSRIDYLVISHFDVDHLGDVPALAARIPIRHVIDHGDSQFPPPVAAATRERFDAYATFRKTIPHTVVKPGDVIPLRGVNVQVVTAGGAQVNTPVKGGGGANALCAQNPQAPLIERDVEDNQSIGLLITFGNFRMLDLADLEAHHSHRLVCPVNLIGQVDVYHVNVHGQFKGVAPELVGAIRPTVMLMGNGPRKGADPQSWPILRAAPGAPDIWQTHYAEHGSADTNPPADFIANLQGPADDHQLIKLSISADGSYTLSNSRNGFSKTYHAGQGNGVAQQYVARHVNDVVRLEDTRYQTAVSIIPSVGNIAYQMTVKGHNVLRWPYASIEDMKAKPGLSALPFVGPWMGRLDEQAFYANGKRYAFDMELGNVRGAVPIHGFLTTNNHWQVIEVKADGRSAWATSRLEFHKHPQWMKQWPFAHTIEITHRLRDGVLEVETRITNLSAEPMPVAVGYHPYFTLTDSPREQWTLSVPAKTLWTFKAGTKLPDGVTVPARQLFPNPDSIPLKDYNLDDGLTDFVRDAQGRAHFLVKGQQQQLDVMFGANWNVINIWSPNPSGTGLGGNAVVNPSADANFIAFEPMASLSNGLNLAHRGLYKEQQYVQPGATWTATFWVKPSGF